MKAQWLLTSLLMVLVGCNPSPTPSTSETPDSSSTPVTSTPVASNPVEASPTAPPITAKPLSPPASTAYTISNQGIGPAKVAMKLGQLKKVLPANAEMKVKSPFIVDFDALAIVQSKEEQYYILYPAGAPPADSDVIEAIVTDNPNYRTAQGVGPGTSIDQAEAVYGKATLSYNTMNESREYVKFANQPSEDIAFRTKPPSGEQLAGIYASSQAELKETNKFQKSASIGLVEVYCRQNCPLPSP